MGTSCTESVWERPAQTLWIRHSFAFARRRRGGLRAPNRAASFSPVVGEGEELMGAVEAGRFRGLRVEHQLIFGRRLQGQVGGLLSLEDAVDVTACLSELVNDIRPVRDQAATCHVVTE